MSFGANNLYALRNPSYVGSFYAGTNKVDVIKYSGIIDNLYKFSSGTNTIAMFDGWDRGMGKFELDGKVVSFDKWDGPYKIENKPEIVELKR